MEQNDYLSKKQEREMKLQTEQNKKRVLKVAKWAAGLVGVFAVLFGFYKLAAKPTAPIPGEFFKAQSRDHIKTEAIHDDYNSNPPTGGWHYAQSVQSGIYDKELPDEQLIHNLEHGHIWITYKPDLPKEQIDILANIAISYGSKIVMVPRSANDAPIALVAWEQLLKLDAVDEQQIKAFIDAYRGRGPENVPDSGFKDFRSGK